MSYYEIGIYGVQCLYFKFLKLEITILPKNDKFFQKLCLCLTLGSLLHDDKSQNIFTSVFVIVGVGSLVVTLNTKLLGGKVSILQSVCVLGYCLGPLTIVLPSLYVVKMFLSQSVGFFGIKMVGVLLSFFWSCKAAINFMVSSIDEKRRLLACYPICLFYFFVGWMILTQ